MFDKGVILFFLKAFYDMMLKNLTEEVKKVARPVKVRKVEVLPEALYFKPVGKKKCEMQEIELKVEELEAMRLKDLEALSQEACAKQMEVSRQTFQNILESARQKITRALVNGQAIHIGGGDFVSKHCKYQCHTCGNVYGIEYQADREKCPSCGSEKVACAGKKACGCQRNCMS